MSINNIVGGKIEASELELETTIEKKIGEIKYDHIQKINSSDIKISAIPSIFISTASTTISTNRSIWKTHQTLKEIIHLVNVTMINPTKAP